MEVQPTTTRARFSIPSIIAIVCAIASFPAAAFAGFLLGMIAVVFGAIGFLLAFSSRVRGGVVSTLAVLGGVLGLVAAVVKAIAWLV
ncbi:MAG TPA: hypothetical protein VGR78_14345 [Verrucomicrobiae bacterium]|nr:hypothetical protein [Verrucomicrobiae bacterium]